MDRTACVLAAAFALLFIQQAASVDIVYGFWNIKQFGRCQFLLTRGASALTVSNDARLPNSSSPR